MRPTSRLRCLVALTLLATACGGTGPEGSATTVSSQPDPTMTTSAPTTTVPPTTTAVGSAPAELAGTWTGEHRDTGDGVSLGLNGTTWSLAWATAPGVGGDLLVDGDTITFSGVYECPGEFEYNWSIQDGVLTLTPIGEDPCPRGGILQKVVFTRAGGG